LLTFERINYTINFMEKIKQLFLAKEKHSYIFRYQAGREADLIKVFAEMASDENRDFDWFDAAVLSYQMGLIFHKDYQLTN